MTPQERAAEAILDEAIRAQGDGLVRKRRIITPDGEVLFVAVPVDEGGNPSLPAFVRRRIEEGNSDPWGFRAWPN